jgi:GNAT superfamily N-acetyltransferase
LAKCPSGDEERVIAFEVCPIQPDDRSWVADLVRARWGDVSVVSRGVRHDPRGLPGYVTVQDGIRTGLITYRIAAGACEIVTLDSLRPGQGIGMALLEQVVAEARRMGCWRVWLVTTNDNLQALGFYQKRGFVLVAVHPNALAHSRQIKPQIPLVGENGIPLRDEIELEMVLQPQRVPELWWRLLWVVSIAACAGGIVLALGPASFPSALDTICAFVVGPNAVQVLSVPDRVMISVALGIGGGLQAGISAIIAYMARHPLRHGECWAWQACVVGLALWLLLDTGLTLWYCLDGYPGLWPKIANDLVFAVMFGVPYAGLSRRNASLRMGRRP